MKRFLMSAVAFAFLLTTMPKLSAGEDLASSIVGTWKLTSFARKEVATGKTDHAPYGEHPLGYAYYTKAGNFLTFTVSKDRKKIEKAEPTDAERAELFKSMYAWGGTYKTEGSKVIYNVDIAWVPSWVGTSRTYQAEMTGSKLTVTTQPFRSPVDGQDIVVITTYDRAE